MVNIEGMGRTFSGDYYVTSVVHTLTADAGYETRFSVQRSAA
jgi:phage protein D